MSRTPKRDASIEAAYWDFARTGEQIAADHGVTPMTVRHVWHRAALAGRLLNIRRPPPDHIVSLCAMSAAFNAAAVAVERFAAAAGTMSVEVDALLDAALEAEAAGDDTADDAIQSGNERASATLLDRLTQHHGCDPRRISDADTFDDRRAVPSPALIAASRRLRDEYTGGKPS